METVLNIVVKEPGKAPEVKLIKHDIEEFQKIVGGLFDMVRVPLMEDMIYMEIGRAHV